MKREKKLVTVSSRIEADLCKKLKAQAAQQKRTLSDIIRLILEAQKI